MTCAGCENRTTKYHAYILGPRLDEVRGIGQITGTLAVTAPRAATEISTVG